MERGRERGGEGTEKRENKSKRKQQRKKQSKEKKSKKKQSKAKQRKEKEEKNPPNLKYITSQGYKQPKSVYGAFLKFLSLF